MRKYDSLLVYFPAIVDVSALLDDVAYLVDLAYFSDERRTLQYVFCFYQVRSLVPLVHGQDKFSKVVGNNDLRRDLIAVQLDIFWKHVYALPRNIVLPKFYECYAHWLQ